VRRRLCAERSEAVSAAESFRPEVILMDVGMPRLNGLDATRRIREQPWGKGITIIALTGWGQEGDRERSKEAGCDGHLVKPVNVSDLDKLLADVRGVLCSRALHCRVDRPSFPPPAGVNRCPMWRTGLGRIRAAGCECGRH
jgi:CheY-like chemotaxis protein